MNREAMPLIVGLLIPILLVILIIVYINGFDITVYIRKINLIYYLLILPFALGLLVVFFWFRKPKD